MASRPTPTGFKKRVPCKRCGLEIENRPERSGYCGSCVIVLRDDAEYFRNLPGGMPETVMYKPRNLAGHNQHTKADQS